jgi:hypothetical protein
MKTRVLGTVVIAFLFAVSVCSNAWSQIFVTSPNNSSSIQQCGTMTVTFNSPQYVSTGVAELYRQGTLMQTYSNMLQGVDNSLSTTGLPASSGYLIRVYDQSNPSNYGSSNTFSISPISAPTATAASSISSSGFSVNWNAVSGATDYRIDVATDPNFTNMVLGYNNVLASSLTGGGTSRAVYSGISACTTYFYRVRTVKNSCTSSSSNTITVLTTPAGTVISPLTEITSTQFSASWLAVPCAIDYTVEISTSASFTALTSQVVTSPSILKTGLPANTTHYVRVKARNSSGFSGYSNVRRADLIAPPVAGSATGITTSSFYTNVSGFSSYYLDVSLVNSFSSFVGFYNNYNTGSPSPTQVSGLTIGTGYFYRVRGVTLFGNTTADSNVVPVFTLPSAPVIAVLTEITSTQFQATWPSVPTAIDYTVEVATNSAFSPLISTHVVTTPTYLKTGLSVNTVHYVRVKARNAFGFSTYSGYRTADLVAPPVATPLGITPSSFIAGYTGSFGSTRIDLSTTSDFLNPFGAYNDYAASGTPTISGLNGSIAYFYRIRGVTGAGNRTASSAPVTIDALPSQPVINPLTEITSTQFQATWPSVSWAIDYTVEIARNSSFAPLISTQVLSSTTYLKSGLYTNTVHYVRVKARNSRGFSSFSIVRVADLIAPPVASNPTTLTPSSFTVSYPNSFSSFFLDVSTSSTFISFLGGYNGFSTGSATSTLITDLVSNTLHYYRLRGKTNAGNTTANSNSVTVLTTLMAPVIAPLTEINSKQFSVSWAAIPTAIDYTVEWSGNSQVVTATSLLKTGLVANTNYSVRVKARNAAGFSSWSNVRTADLVAPPVTTHPYSVTTTSFTANYGTGFPSYMIDVSRSFDFATFDGAYNNFNAGPGTQEVITGLSPNSFRYYRVRGVTNAGNVTVNSNWSVARTPPVALAATAISASGDTFTFNWTAVQGALSYTIGLIGLSSDGCNQTGIWWLENLQGTSYAADLSGTSAQIFSYLVYSYGHLQAGPASNEIYLILGDYAPTPSVPNNIHGNAFTFSWIPIPNVQEYRLDVATDVNFNNIVSGYTDKVVTSPYTVSQLSANTTYYYRLRSKIAFSGTCIPAGSDGFSTNSITRTVTTTCLGCRTRTESEEPNLIEVDERFAIYPNPVHGVLHVPLRHGYDMGEVQLRLYESSGRQIYPPLEWNTRGADVDVSSFSTGLYLIRVLQDGKAVTQKFLKE